MLIKNLIREFQQTTKLLHDTRTKKLEIIKRGKIIKDSDIELMQELQHSRDDYLDLMLNCLTGTIYQDSSTQMNVTTEYNDELRESGWDWPSVAHTMIGRKRLKNVQRLVESVIDNKVPGDFIETGVWRGGACIMMRAVLKAYNEKDRKVWLADSFEGLPPPNAEDYPQDKDEKFHEYSELAVSLEQVKTNFDKYGLLDKQVDFIKGWFKDSLKNPPMDSLAILRLDGDLYESTIQPLESLYDKLSVGGYVIVDDYNVVEACKLAVHDFLLARKLTPTIIEIDEIGVYWKKKEK